MAEDASAIDIEPLRRWIGRREEHTDVAEPARFKALAAWLDHPTPPWPPDEIPPLGHWLCFLPTAPQSQLTPDGHPPRGGLIPPVPLPRRMWAGSKVEFVRPAPLGATLRRCVTVADVALKSGGSGDFIKVSLLNDIYVGADLAIRERQDLIYRPAAGQPAAPSAVREAEPPEPAPFDYARAVLPDPAMLFRFSALTFNAHRIHYDRDYACKVEGYPGLMVHGPMQAMLLVDLFLRQGGSGSVRGFACRALRPLFDGAAFQIKGRSLDGGARLWSEDAQGQVCMEASVTL